MELFVTKPSKQHKNVIFSPFVHSCINIKVFLDNIAARLKSRNAFPFLQQLPSLSWLIIFYRGEFDQDYLSFSFSWVKRGDWLVITTDDQTLFSGRIEEEPRDNKQDQVVRESILDPDDRLLWNMWFAGWQKLAAFRRGQKWP